MSYPSFNLTSELLNPKIRKKFNLTSKIKIFNQTFLNFQEHNNKDGSPKLLKECSLPLTGKNVVDMIVTEKGVFNVDKEKGLTLIELAEDITLEQLTAATDAEFSIAEDLKPMQQI